MLRLKGAIWTEAHRRGAVVAYTLLYDVCFSFCSASAELLFCNEQILFLSWRRGRGAGGECPGAKTPYSILSDFAKLHFAQSNLIFLAVKLVPPLENGKS